MVVQVADHPAFDAVVRYGLSDTSGVFACDSDDLGTERLSGGIDDVRVFLTEAAARREMHRLSENLSAVMEESYASAGHLGRMRPTVEMLDVIVSEADRKPSIDVGTTYVQGAALDGRAVEEVGRQHGGACVQDQGVEDGSALRPEGEEFVDDRAGDWRHVEIEARQAIDAVVLEAAPPSDHEPTPSSEAAEKLEFERFRSVTGEASFVSSVAELDEAAARQGLESDQPSERASLRDLWLVEKFVAKGAKLRAPRDGEGLAERLLVWARERHAAQIRI